ncbi:hypothetical protein KUA24_42 [Vibrio phage HNL01]|nr:hypothetical protein KUA24_42 [Vibrio phage HNL01]
MIYDMFSESYAESINRKINELRAEFRDGIPATIVGTDDYESQQCVAVEFAIKDIHTYLDSTELRAMKLNKVFVRLPKFGGWEFHFPVKVGDPVILHFSSKDLNIYLAGDGSQVSQPVGMIGEVEDCYAELGFGTRLNHNKPSLTDLVIENPNTSVRITPNGVINIDNSSTLNVTCPTTNWVGTINQKGDFNQVGNFDIKGNTTQAGNVTQTGNTTVSGTLHADGAITSGTSVGAPSYGAFGGGTGTLTIGSIDSDSIVVASATVNGVPVEGHSHDGKVPPF